MTVNRLFAAAVVGLAAASFSYADRAEAATFNPVLVDETITGAALDANMEPVTFTAVAPSSNPPANVVIPDVDDIGWFLGNDCPNVLGTGGFGTCLLNGSPVIAKWDSRDTDNGHVFDADSTFEGNSVFSTGDFSITRDLFEVAFDDDGWFFNYNLDGNPNAPGITGFAAKAGTGFFVYLRDGEAFLGETLSNVRFFSPKGIGDLSHITWYDSVVPIPLPAAAWMLLSALGGLGFLGLRRKQTA